MVIGKTEVWFRPFIAERSTDTARCRGHNPPEYDSRSAEADEHGSPPPRVNAMIARGADRLERPTIQTAHNV